MPMLNSHKTLILNNSYSGLSSFKILPENVKTNLQKIIIKKLQ